MQLPILDIIAQIQEIRADEFPGIRIHRERDTLTITLPHIYMHASTLIEHHARTIPQHDIIRENGRITLRTSRRDKHAHYERIITHIAHELSSNNIPCAVTGGWKEL